MTGTLLSDVNEYVRIVHSCVKRGRPVCIAAEGSVTDGVVTDGIKDHIKARSTRLRIRRR
jgi:hypothetical protein